MLILEHTSLVRLAQRNYGCAFGQERLELWQGFTKQTLRESPSYSGGTREISTFSEQMERRDFQDIQSTDGELTPQRVFST